MEQALHATHHRDVDRREWDLIAVDFDPQELADSRTGEVFVTKEALRKLQEMRDILGAPLLVTSGYRSEATNRAVGGVPGSQHTFGRAFDLAVQNHDPAAMIQAAEQAGFTGIGTYPDRGFIHVDLGRERRWGAPFPARIAGRRFAPEAKPTDAERGQAKIGGGLAAIGTVVTQIEPIMQAAGPWLMPVLAVVIAAGLTLALYDWWQARRRILGDI